MSDWDDSVAEIERLMKREKQLEEALGEALGMLRVYVSADTTIALAQALARIRAWSELLK
jgi:hypothetical protein